MTRILIENGTYALDNMGDVAMLQVACNRINAALPDARVQVLTYHPDRLARYCPNAEPLDGHGITDLLNVPLTPEWLHRRGPSVRRFAARAANWLQARLPDQQHRKALARRGDTPRVRDVQEAIDHCDLLLLSGGGYLTDVFPDETNRAFRLIHLALRRRIPVVLVGQGIGPLKNATIRRQARRLLPRVTAIRLREGVHSLPALRGIGVPEHVCRVTGDDAIELAAAPLPDGATPTDTAATLGLNLRDSSYSGIDAADRERLQQGITRICEHHRLEPMPLPIAQNPAYNDLASVSRLFDIGPEVLAAAQAVDTPAKLVAQVARCRLVITGSYHAGVFALCRGIPVIGLSKSAYYDAKFAGLIQQFGPACRVIRLDDADFAQSLQAMTDELIKDSAKHRETLTARAHEQIAASREMFERLPELINR